MRTFNPIPDEIFEQSLLGHSALSERTNALQNLISTGWGAFHSELAAVKYSTPPTGHTRCSNNSLS